VRVDIRAQFGRLIRKRRTEQGLTQEELAFRAEVDVTYLSDLERGRWNPSLAVIVDLSRAFDVHPSDLLKDLRIRGGLKKPARKRSTTK
jgi:transcriptional regulator with XRE-family HTH domain